MDSACAPGSHQCRLSMDRARRRQPLALETAEEQEACISTQKSCRRQCLASKTAEE